MSFFRNRPSDQGGSTPGTASGTIPPEEELGTLYRRHYVMVQTRAARILRNDTLAEDVCHEVFLRFIEHRQQGGREQQPAAFLYRMTTNLCLNRLRDTRHRNQLLQHFMPQHEGIQEPGLDPTDALRVRRMLAEVDEECATIALYYYVDGLEQDEIAELLSLHRRTVSRRLEAFRQEAKRVLQRRQTPNTPNTTGKVVP